MSQKGKVLHRRPLLLHCLDDVGIKTILWARTPPSFHIFLIFFLSILFLPLLLLFSMMAFCPLVISLYMFLLFISGNPVPSSGLMIITTCSVTHFFLFTSLLG